MTKWCKDIVCTTKDGVRIVDQVAADPAQDPEVQARVLRAYFETFGNVTATQFQKDQRALLAENIRKGLVTLQVEEDRT